MDASTPGHIHLRKYNPHPYLLIYIQGLDSSNSITIQSPKQPKILRFVKKYILRCTPLIAVFHKFTNSQLHRFKASQLHSFTTP